jgi:hypothetical protein
MPAAAPAPSHTTSPAMNVGMLNATRAGISRVVPSMTTRRAFGVLGLSGDAQSPRRASERPNPTPTPIPKAAALPTAVRPYRSDDIPAHWRRRHLPREQRRDDYQDEEDANGRQPDSRERAEAISDLARALIAPTLDGRWVTLDLTRRASPAPSRRQEKRRCRCYAQRRPRAELPANENESADRTEQRERDSDALHRRSVPHIRRVVHHQGTSPTTGADEVPILIGCAECALSIRSDFGIPV